MPENRQSSSLWVRVADKLTPTVIIVVVLGGAAVVVTALILLFAGGGNIVNLGTGDRDVITRLTEQMDSLAQELRITQAQSEAARADNRLLAQQVEALEARMQSGFADLTARLDRLEQSTDPPE